MTQAQHTPGPVEIGDSVNYYGAHFTVTRVYKDTVTIRGYGRGLAEGRLVTYRGVGKDEVSPFKRAA